MHQHSPWAGSGGQTSQSSTRMLTGQVPLLSALQRQGAPEAAGSREGLWVECQAVRSRGGIETDALRKSSPPHTAGEKQLPPPPSSPTCSGWSVTHRKGNSFFLWMQCICIRLIKIVPCQLNNCDIRKSGMQMQKGLWSLTYLYPNPDCYLLALWTGEISLASLVLLPYLRRG